MIEKSNDREMKWQGNEMTRKWNDREMKWQGNEMTGKLNDRENINIISVEKVENKYIPKISSLPTKSSKYFRSNVNRHAKRKMHKIVNKTFGLGPWSISLK